SDRPVGSDPAVHEPGHERAHDAQGVSGRRRPVHAVRGRRRQPGLPGGKGDLDAHDVERPDRAADDRATPARGCDEPHGPAAVRRRAHPRPEDPNGGVYRPTRRRQVLTHDAWTLEGARPMSMSELLRFVTASDAIVEPSSWGPHEWLCRPGLTD